MKLYDCIYFLNTESYIIKKLHGKKWDKTTEFACEWGGTEGRLLASRTSVLALLLSAQGEGSTRVHTLPQALSPPFHCL